MSAGTDEKIFSQKRAGLKHFKATCIIIDITYTSQFSILTGIYPALVHFHQFLQKMKFPYEIILITSRGMVSVNKLGKNISIEDLTVAFINEFQYSVLNMIDPILM